MVGFRLTDLDHCSIVDFQDIRSEMVFLMEGMFSSEDHGNDD